jgi:hypothetical protein
MDGRGGKSNRLGKKVRAVALAEAAALPDNDPSWTTLSSVANG